MKTLPSLLLGFCLLFGFGSARATTVIPPTFDQLVTQAELIFQGTVTDVRSQWTGEGAQRHIVTYVTLQVNEKIKGEPGASQTLQMLGGTVDGTTMEVTDAPKFAPGDRNILFVENNGRQFIPLVGIMHGRFHLQRDNQSGHDLVVGEHGEPVRDLAKLGHEGDAVAPDATTKPALGAAEFKAAIRAKLAAAN